MTYVKPQGVDAVNFTDSDYLALDIHNPTNIGRADAVDQPYRSGTIVATAAGYGVRYRVRGDSDGADNAVFDVEILDALPLRDSDVRVSVRYDSDAEALTTATNIYGTFSN